MWHEYGNGSDFAGGWFWLFFIVIVVLIVIALTIYLIVKLVQSSSNSTKSVNDNSLNILNERLARGEITPEEHTNLRKYIGR